jgi:hypothetical protein
MVRAAPGVRHHHAVTEEPREEPDAAEPSDELGPEDEHWGVNAAIGAAAIAAKTATDVAGAVTASTPGRVVEGAARWIARPLSKQGEEVRTRLEEEGLPAAQQAIRQATPGVVQAVDINEILAAIDVDALLDRIDINRLVDRIDVGAIVAKVDVNELVGQVDVDALVSQVDVGALIARVDLDSLLDSIDLDALLARIDIGALLDQIDLNQLLTKIDLNTLLQSVDLEALLTRLDLNQLLGSVDLDQLLASIDINELIQRLDMDALVSNTEIGGIIAQSTSGVASEALDAVRSQGVGMDNFIARLTNRVLRRDPAELPAGPTLLIEAQLALPGPVHDTTASEAVATPVDAGSQT